MTEPFATSAIPDGITFGHKVLVVPNLHDMFTHSASITGVRNGNPYKWIQRGQDIATLSISGSHAGNPLLRAMTSKTMSETVRSPVSGLVLHSTYDTWMSSYFDDFRKSERPPLASFCILLPDDEPPAEGPDYMFDRVCWLAKSFEHYFMKPSRYWSMGPMDPSRFEDVLATQRRAATRVFDALPIWADYINEARTKYPNLRPALKHLV